MFTRRLALAVYFGARRGPSAEERGGDPLFWGAADDRSTASQTNTLGPSPQSGTTLLSLLPAFYSVPLRDVHGARSSAPC